MQLMQRQAWGENYFTMLVNSSERYHSKDSLIERQKKQRRLRIDYAKKHLRSLHCYYFSFRIHYLNFKTEFVIPSATMFFCSVVYWI